LSSAARSHDLAVKTVGIPFCRGQRRAAYTHSRLARDGTCGTVKALVKRTVYNMRALRYCRLIRSIRVFKLKIIRCISIMRDIQVLVENESAYSQ
jgi:hypothetical protein